MKRILVILFALIFALSAVSAQPAVEISDNPVNVQKVYVEKDDVQIFVVTDIQEFGNVDLDIKADDFFALGYELGDTFDVRFGNGYTLNNIPFYNGWYTKIGDALLVAYPGSEYPCVSINYKNLSEIGNISVGETVEIRPNTKGGKRDIQLLYSLKYSNRREDYASDESFANFRMVATTGIAPDKLYRFASPVDNQRNRAAFTDALIRKYGVGTVINLAETDEKIEKLLSGNSGTPYYRSLFENGKVIAIGLSADYSGDKFGRSLVSGFARFVKNDMKTPIGIHCLEGKDRTGFVFALLEALMGASESEIIDDYMITYSNYYGISKEQSPERYDGIVKNHICEMMQYIKGLGDNLSDGARAYFLNNGMSPAELDALTEALSVK